MSARILNGELITESTGHVIPPKLVRSNFGYFELMHWKHLTENGKQFTQGFYKVTALPFIHIEVNGTGGVNFDTLL